MALLGNGALGVWHGIAAGQERTVDDWYNDEHNAERVAIDGFLRARRYVNVGQGRRYFSRYDTSTVSVLGSPDYLKALDNPSERSRANFPLYRDTLRGAYRVTARQGFADGGFTLVGRFFADDVPSVDALNALAGQLLSQPPVTRTEIWDVDAAITSITTQEKTLRKAAENFPTRVLLVDGSDPATLRETLQAAPARDITSGAEIDTYKLVLHLAKDT